MEIYYNSDSGTLYRGDCLEVLRWLPSDSVDCGVTSPPYWGLRDYGIDGQLGLESTPEEYIGKLVEIFREFRRILRNNGTLWLNLGDSYCGTGNKKDYQDPKYKKGRNGQTVAVSNKIKGLKSKDLVGIPWRVALALQADGWYLRQDIIWHKPNPMPESVTDRCTKSHEYIFLLSKRPKYYYDHEAIKEPAVTPLNSKARQSFGSTKKLSDGVKAHTNRHGKSYRDERKNTKNKRSVWTVTTKPFRDAHFAVFPPDLIKPCILAGCPIGGVVFDPFFGAGTTGLVALQTFRRFGGIELSEKYCQLAVERLFG